MDVERPTGWKLVRLTVGFKVPTGSVTTEIRTPIEIGWLMFILFSIFNINLPCNSSCMDKSTLFILTKYVTSFDNFKEGCRNKVSLKPERA